jgi:hypothetical protein
MNKPMTAQEFVENSSRCPKCHSENVSWDEISVEGDSTYQDGSCEDCDARFYTVSRLVGYGLYEHDAADAEVRTVVVRLHTVVGNRGGGVRRRP